MLTEAERARFAQALNICLTLDEIAIKLGGVEERLRLMSDPPGERVLGESLAEVDKALAQLRAYLQSREKLAADSPR